MLHPGNNEELTTDFNIDVIPVDHERGWTVTVDGVELPDVGKITISSDYGTLTYGLRPEGYDGWGFAEAKGGGAVTIPYAEIDGELYVGLIEEDRPNMGGRVFCVIGGFVMNSESHQEAGRRELDEESELASLGALIEINARAVNSNRLFFVTNSPAGEGIRTYRLQLEKEQLEMVDGVYKVREGVTDHPKLGTTVFMPWRAAVRATPDVIARSAIATLIAEID